MKTFTKIQPFGANAYTYWISGIYKIVSYEKGEYLAFYIPDYYNNWGNHVAEPPRNGKHGKVWDSFKAATDACKDHARYNRPSDGTIQRAARIKADLTKQANEHSKKAA